MICDKGGKARLLEKAKRKTATRKTECPLKITITGRQLHSRDWGPWIKNGEHNHHRSGSASAHSVQRKRTAEKLAITKSLSLSWTNERRHYGNTVIPKVEKRHNIMKRF